MKRIISISLLVLLTGCIFPSKHDDKIVFKYPPDIAVMCGQALESAKQAIQSTGTQLKLKGFGCEVIKKPGEKKFGNMWCWYSKEWNFYVGGLCWGTKIEIGCDPVTGSGVLFNVLKHEFGHYWLYSNFGDMTHNNKYTNVFDNWKMKTKSFKLSSSNNQDIKEMMKVASKDMTSGEWFSIEGVDSNNVQFHIDGVIE